MAGWAPSAQRALQADLVSALRALLAARPGHVHHITDGHLVTPGTRANPTAEADGVGPEAWAAIVHRQVVASLDLGEPPSVREGAGARAAAACAVLGGFVEPLRTGGHVWIAPDLVKMAGIRGFSVTGPRLPVEKALVVLHDAVDVASVVLPESGPEADGSFVGGVPAWAIPDKGADAAANNDDDDDDDDDGGEERKTPKATKTRAPPTPLRRINNMNLVPIAGVPATAAAVVLTATTAGHFARLLTRTFVDPPVCRLSAQF